MTDDPTHRPLLRLRQNPDGVWVCRTSHLPMSFAEGATADEAIAKIMRGLEDYKEFLLHIHGDCDSLTCGRCARGDAGTRGIWNDVENS
jgi:predicted RNase H-like HicB family nuclease